MSNDQQTESFNLFDRVPNRSPVSAETFGFATNVGYMLSVPPDVTITTDEAADSVSFSWSVGRGLTATVTVHVEPTR